jgi:phospholipid N-methyltransferase
MAHPLDAHRTFFREFRRHFHTTGSVIPSSPFLAKALARYVKQDNSEAGNQPRSILEVGPGTGAVTDKIVAALGPQDRLALVEINDEFVALLKRRFETLPQLKAVASRVTILQNGVERLTEERHYDLIVSGLPLNNFSVADVEQILSVFARLLKPSGRLSFFQYIGLRRLRSLVSQPAERERLHGVGLALDRLLRQRELRREAIWLNFPPAWVHHVQFPTAPS